MVLQMHGVHSGRVGHWLSADYLRCVVVVAVEHSRLEHIETAPGQLEAALKEFPSVYSVANDTARQLSPVGGLWTLRAAPTYERSHATRHMCITAHYSKDTRTATCEAACTERISRQTLW